MKSVMLTTVDNPYDPFDDWKEWYTFDHSHGYNSSELLARLTETSNEFTAEIFLKDLEQTIDEIIRENPSGMYRKVVKEKTTR